MAEITPIRWTVTAGDSAATVEQHDDGTVTVTGIDHFTPPHREWVRTFPGAEDALTWVAAFIDEAEQARQDLHTARTAALQRRRAAERAADQAIVREDPGQGKEPR